MVNKLDRSFYNTGLSQAFSPCGNYLAVGDIYGEVHVFCLSKVVKAETDLSKEDLSAKNKFAVIKDSQVNSLVTVKNCLLVGGLGEIHAFYWKSLKGSKNIKPAWSISIPNQKDAFERADITSLIFHDENNHIYASCGEHIYEFDLETRVLVKIFTNHSDYIHCLKLTNYNDLVSGAEDGKVNIWDLRTNKVTNKIEPHLNDKLVRPEIGKWIGDVSCNDDYLVCGGGPRLSLWHYRFLMNSIIFPIDDKGIHVAEIYNDKILAGGRSELFYQMSFTGNIISEIPVSAVTVYSAIYQKDPFEVLVLSGSSSKIDVCANFMYKNQQLFL